MEFSHNIKIQQKLIFGFLTVALFSAEELQQSISFFRIDTFSRNRKQLL